MESPAVKVSTVYIQVFYVNSGFNMMICLLSKRIINADLVGGGWLLPIMPYRVMPCQVYKRDSFMQVEVYEREGNYAI